MSIGHVAMAPSGQLVLWTLPSQSEGDEAASASASAVYLLEGLRYQEQQLVFADEPQPQAALRLRRIETSGPPASGSFAGG